MDLRQLRYFSVLAEEKHFGRAARRLALSQPPLSLAIRQLEDELGAKLLERDSRNVDLTPAGVALQREAGIILRRAAETQALVKSIAEGKTGQLRIGFGGSMLYRGLSEIVATFRTAAPSVEVKLRELNSVEQIEALQRDELDLAFVHGRAVPPGLEGFRYHAEPFAACLPVGHPAADGRVISLVRLRDEDFVLFARTASPDYYELIVAACLAAGFTPNVRHEVRHWLSVVAFVAKGLGVALVPQTLRSCNIDGTAFLPLSNQDVLSETWCIWKSADPQSAALGMMIATARDQSACLEDAPLATAAPPGRSRR